MTQFNPLIHHFKASLTGLMLLLATSNLAYAEDDSSAPKTQYVDIRPSFVINFGGVKKKLKFAKVDISIQVASIEQGNLLEKHFPLVRNTFVMLLSRQSDETMGSSAGQETIRVEALKEVQNVLKEETGRVIADDLYFTNFVVQQ